MKIARTLAVVAVLVLSHSWFPIVSRIFSNLHRSWNEVLVSDSPGRLIGEVGIARAGEHVLPPMAQHGISLLRSHDVRTYRLSHSLEQNIEIRQRIVEGAYPIRNVETAAHVLQPVAEPVAATCERIAVREGIALVRCP